MWRLRHSSSNKLVYWSWFTPHKDALLINPELLPVVKDDHRLLGVAEHIIIEDVGIWHNFDDEEEEPWGDSFDRLRIEWFRVLPKPECPPLPGSPAWNLRTIDFAVDSVTKIDRKYPPNFARRLFAGESVRVVDLRDAEAIRGIEQIMVDEVSQFMDPGRCWWWKDGLQKSLKGLELGGAELFKKVREETLDAMVRLYYKRQKSRATLPSPFKPRSGRLDGGLDNELPRALVDMEVTWVKEFAERFSIRPVHVFVKVDDWSYCDED